MSLSKPKICSLVVPCRYEAKWYMTYVFRSIQTSTLQYMTSWWFQTFFLKLSQPKKWGTWCFSHFDVQNVRMVGSTTTEIMYTKRPERRENVYSWSWLMLAIHVTRYGRGVHVTQQYARHIYIYIQLCIDAYIFRYIYLSIYIFKHIFNIYIFTHLWLINDVRDLPTETTSTVYFVETRGIWYNKNQPSIFCNQDPHNQIS